jgi:hypothetical protein
MPSDQPEVVYLAPHIRTDMLDYGEESEGRL